MDDEKLFRLAEKFVALCQEFLKLVSESELECDAEDDDLNLGDWDESEDEIPP